MVTDGKAHPFSVDKITYQHSPSSAFHIECRLSAMYLYMQPNPYSNCYTVSIVTSVAFLCKPVVSSKQHSTSLLLIRTCNDRWNLLIRLGTLLTVKMMVKTVLARTLLLFTFMHVMAVRLDARRFFLEMQRFCCF